MGKRGVKWGKGAAEWVGRGAGEWGSGKAGAAQHSIVQYTGHSTPYNTVPVHCVVQSTVQCTVNNTVYCSPPPPSLQLEAVAFEPPHGRFARGHPWPQYRQLSCTLRALVYDVIALEGCLAAQIQAPLQLRTAVQGEVQAVAGNCARWEPGNFGHFH